MNSRQAETRACLKNHSCNLHSTLCDVFHPEYPAFDNVPELVRYIRQLELISEKMPANEALHFEPVDQFTSNTGHGFDSQEYDWNSSKKSSLQMENNHDLQTTKNSSGEATTFEESPQYLLTDIADSLLNGRPLPYYAPASSDDVPAPRTRVLFFTEMCIRYRYLLGLTGVLYPFSCKSQGLSQLLEYEKSMRTTAFLPFIPYKK